MVKEVNLSYLDASTLIQQRLHLPFQPTLAGRTINIHLLLEYAAFFTAFRYYLYLRKRRKDTITSSNRLSIILGAAIGAIIGSRVMGFLEYPFIHFSITNGWQLFQLKTIMGGLFGGLLGVELTKWRLKEKQSSGDLFTLPIILGIFIGRIGCFLSGTNEFTYGEVTTSFTGMDLGDGLRRHPIALYELVFLLLLFIGLKRIQNSIEHESGLLFKYFMISYFAFRFIIEFIKPNTFFILGLSSIQWLCILCFVYYYKTILKLLRYAYPKIHVL